MESNLGRLEIKDQRLKWNPLDLNTRTGGSLSENGYGKCMLRPGCSLRVGGWVGV